MLALILCGFIRILCGFMMILCGIKDSLFKTTEQFSDLVNSSTFIPVLNETHGGIFHRNQYVKDILLGFFKSKSS